METWAFLNFLSSNREGITRFRVEMIGKYIILVMALLCKPPLWYASVSQTFAVLTGHATYFRGR